MDVVGSTALANQMDPEEWTAIMNGAFDRFYPAIYRYEMHCPAAGQRTAGLFRSAHCPRGRSGAGSEGSTRHVRARAGIPVGGARAVRRRVWVLIGLNTGPVIVGRVGSDMRYEYAPMGGSVNLAARMQTAARPMSVLISDHAFRFVAPLFDTEDAGRIQVKGLTEPVQGYRVLRAKAEPGTIRGLAGLQSPMVGREAELAALLHLCEAVQAGLGRAALVVGEPGLGKTRLITEWKAAVEEDRQQHGTTPRWVEGPACPTGRDWPITC